MPIGSIGSLASYIAPNFIMCEDPEPPRNTTNLLNPNRVLRPTKEQESELTKYLKNFSFDYKTDGRPNRDDTAFVYTIRGNQDPDRFTISRDRAGNIIIRGTRAKSPSGTAGAGFAINPRGEQIEIPK